MSNGEFIYGNADELDIVTIDQNGHVQLTGTPSNWGAGSCAALLFRTMEDAEAAVKALASITLRAFKRENE